MNPSRRHFLKQALALSVGLGGLRAVAGAGAGGWSLLGCAGAGDPGSGPGYGPLIDDPARVLDLPQGFRYRVFSRVGEIMDDGLPVPGSHDGMAAFPGPDGLTILIRNHELVPGQEIVGPFAKLDRRDVLARAEWIYDPGTEAASPGSTTTLVYDTRRGRLVRHFLSLTGTSTNCAGGPTPWNSWISCEETCVPASRGLTRAHGYNFEVPARPEIGLTVPVPLRAMGCFEHEAVAVDPGTGIVYETEDKDDSLLYRFLPEEPGRLAAGGRLQALAFLDAPSRDTRNWKGAAVPLGSRHPVRWIDLEDVDRPAEDDLRLRGFAKGAACFARGEGMGYGNRSIYFTCTSGGGARKGQIWKYVPSPREGTPDESEMPGTLELFVEPNDGDVVDNCDNLTVAPGGDLFVCEDGPGDQFLLGVTPEGSVYRFAHNAGNKIEFAGATFSPDGSTLFVNIQAGMTLAITGPWETRIRT